MTTGIAFQPFETFRHCMEARQPREAGGGACSVLVRRQPDRPIQLIFTGVLEAAANLTEKQAEELSTALADAIRVR